MAPIRIGTKAVIIQDDQILLIEYRNRRGVHYNLPGGGVKRGESVRKSLKREVLEETGCTVQVGDLLLVAEYDPKKHNRLYGRLHKLTLIFRCEIKKGKPGMPPSPDQDQVDVRWFPLDDLPDTLYPQFHDLLREAVRSGPVADPFTTRP